jgi:ATP-dependent DNA helicase RecG
MHRIVETYVGDVPESLPEAVRQRRRLVGLAQALRDAHFPSNDTALAAALRRLAFEDFLLLQLGLAILRARTTRARGLSMSPPGRLVGQLRAAPPYTLTGAQERVWEEIRRDMGAPFPMHRLLQGDVGSGKTVVAALAVLTAIEAGYQAAVMAPTEILAEQHFMTFRQLLEPLGITVGLLTSAGKSRERAARRAALAAGETACVVGTHALVQEGVEFRRLGLAVVEPSVSTAGRRRTSAPARARRQRPAASATAVTAGNPSGMADTARVMAVSSISPIGWPRRIPATATIAQTPSATPTSVRPRRSI